jgi:hypothetical protein
MPKGICAFTTQFGNPIMSNRRNYHDIGNLPKKSYKKTSFACPN